MPSTLLVSKHCEIEVPRIVHEYLFGFRRCHVVAANVPGVGWVPLEGQRGHSWFKYT